MHKKCPREITIIFLQKFFRKTINFVGFSVGVKLERLSVNKKKVHIKFK